MEGEGKDKGKEGGGGDKLQSITVKIGDAEKSLSADDVVKLVGEHGNLSKQIKDLEPVARVLSKYEGVAPEVYMTQAEGALAVVSHLIEAGILDESGKIIDKAKGKAGSDGKDKDDLSKLLNLGKEGSDKLTGDEKIAAIVAKAVKAAVDPLNEELKESKKIQNRLVKMDVRDRLVSENPGLTKDDAEAILDTALADRTKDLKQHVAEYVELKQKHYGKMREHFAGEFGVDLKDWEAKKKLKDEAEKSGDKLGLSTILKGKKISFSGGKDSITPRSAMRAFFSSFGGN